MTHQNEIARVSEALKVIANKLDGVVSIEITDELRTHGNNLGAMKAPTTKNIKFECFKCGNPTALTIDPDTLNFYCFSCGLKGSGWFAFSNAYASRNIKRKDVAPILCTTCVDDTCCIRTTLNPKINTCKDYVAATKKVEEPKDPLLQTIPPDETKQVDYLKAIAFVVHLLWSSLPSKDLFDLLEKMSEPWESDCEGLTFTAGTKVPPFAKEIVDKYLLEEENG